MQGASDTTAEEDGVPRLAAGWEQRGVRLSPEEGFLLSRIDGSTSWRVLRQIAGVPPEQVDRCLKRWLADGLVEMQPSPCGSGSRSQPAADAAASGLDPSLELPIEIQQQVLEFEPKLDGSYFEILGVARDAEERAIKRSYFALSKVFHPDRYFGRDLGPFGARLDVIFKKVALAYELLIDPTTRAEVERTLGSAHSPGPDATARTPEAGAPPRKLTRRETLERLRRQFRIPEEILTERRFKARQFHEASRVACHQHNWKEAASSIRLAIAFDPWTDDYKEEFAGIQAEVNQLRAAELLEASGALGGSSASEALKLLEEAMGYRPGDAEVHVRAARAACELEDFDRAHEYAERACELAPESASYKAVLARVLRRQGLRQKAKKVLDEASRLDPHDEEVMEELRRLRKSPAGARGGNR